MTPRGTPPSWAVALASLALGACGPSGGTREPALSPQPTPPPDPRWVIAGEGGVWWSEDSVAWVRASGLPTNTTIRHVACIGLSAVASDGVAVWTSADFTSPDAWSPVTPTTASSSVGGLCATRDTFALASWQSVFGTTWLSLSGSHWLETPVQDCEIAYSISAANDRLLLGGRLRSIMQAAAWGYTASGGWSEAVLVGPTLAASFGEAAFGNGWYVAAGFNAGRAFWRSNDGAIWNAVEQPGSGTHRAIAFGNGRWLAVGTEGAGAGSRWRSNDDGVTWMSDPGPTPLHDVCWGDGQFLVVGDAGLIEVSATTEPGSWSPRTPSANAPGALWQAIHLP